MNLLKPFLIAGLLISLAGCAGPTTNPFGIYPGQWRPAQDVGKGRHLIEGYSSNATLKGAREFCGSRTMQLVSMTPHTSESRATLLFTCD